jgi:3-dehydroquinate synthase
MYSTLNPKALINSIQLSPPTPLRHGHAISIDMAYSATLANQRGLLSDEEHRRLLNLFSRAGLSMDHEMFDEDMLDKATKAILKTRDGLLRAAVPNPIGTCVFLNDVSAEEMNKALRRHKELMKEYPRNGEGLEAYVDASDTGYTQNDIAIEDVLQKDSVAEKLSNGKADGLANGQKQANNGIPAGLQGIANGYSNGYKN